MNILILLLLSSFAFSRDISVKELLELAEAYSPQIKSEALAVNVSEARLKQAHTLANPVFSFQGGRLRTATQGGGVMDFSLNQPLPWPGKRKALIQGQEFLKKLSELSKEEAALEVSHRVLALSVELAAMQELGNHYAERKRTFALIQRSLRSRPQVSPKQQVDRDLIESQLMLMEKELIMLSAHKESLEAELKILTNAAFDSIVFNWKELPLAQPREYYLNMIDSSPKGRMIKVENQIAANRIEQARLEARPDVMVGVNYRKEEVAPVNHFYHGQFAVVIPILDHGQHSVAAARAEERKTSALNQVELNRIKTEVFRLYSRYEGGKKMMDVFRLQDLHKMEQKFSNAEGLFRKGQIDANTLLQIDQQVHSNIENIYLVRFQYISSLSELNLISGLKAEI